MRKYIILCILFFFIAIILLVREIYSYPLSANANEKMVSKEIESSDKQVEVKKFIGNPLQISNKKVWMFKTAKNEYGLAEFKENLLFRFRVEALSYGDDFPVNYSFLNTKKGPHILLWGEKPYVDSTQIKVKLLCLDASRNEKILNRQVALSKGNFYLKALSLPKEIEGCNITSEDYEFH